MLKKITIMSTILLSSMYAFNVEPATNEVNMEDANFRVMQRVVYVHNFIRIAEDAFNANNDAERTVRNTELKHTFDVMQNILGYHELVSFHSVATQ